jgi:hypothetical protein
VARPTIRTAFFLLHFKGRASAMKEHRVLDLLPPAELSEGQRDSLDLIRELNLRIGATAPALRSSTRALPATNWHIECNRQQWKSAILKRKSTALRASYGLEEKEPRLVKFGRKCLLARRLVERGVRFVQIYDMPDKDGWDAHSKLTDNHTPRARWIDQPIAALIADLKQRGLLEETLVICASEFGRTPMLQGDKGRQHNAAGFTVWMAGGGVQPGIRMGATDEIGLMAVDRPHSFKDFHATILAALGLRNDDLFFEHNGRSERLTGVAGTGT